MEGELENRTLHDFKNCCVVVHDMLDSNKKSIDPFIPEEDITI